MDPKPILKIVPGLQAMALVAENLPKMKNFGMKPAKKLGMNGKGFVKKGVKTLVGIGMLGVTSSMINDL